MAAPGAGPDARPALGHVVDPFGHQWFIGTSIEEVSPEKMQARYDDTP